MVLPDSLESARRLLFRQASMKILGLSGFENAMPFKRAQWPGLDEREYRMSQGHDAAAALVVDGVCVAAAEEERFNRRKHSGDFPASAIRYCLAEAGLSFADLDSIGILYSLVTLHLGFDFNADEYKIMGLAPYGDPERFRPFFAEHVKLMPGGAIRIPILRLNRHRVERETYAATRRFLEGQLVKARRPDEGITDDHCDVAAALQECLDRAMLHVCGAFAHRTGLR